MRKALVVAFAVVVVVVANAAASSTPVGPLPKGPVTTISTTHGQLVAIALPHAKAGYVWRVARPYSSKVVVEVTEADVGGNVVVVYRAVGRGTTSLVYAMTRGDTSPKAVRSATFRIRSA